MSQETTIHSAIREALIYCPKSGRFTWSKTGELAGSRHIKGYWSISFFKKRFLAHRLAFFIMTGKWPNAQIDHVNNNREDNRWENLREASHSENRRNSKRNRNNTSGVKGVTWNRRRKMWQSQVFADGVSHSLGCFATISEAATAVRSARESLHGQFANHGG